MHCDSCRLGFMLVGFDQYQFLEGLITGIEQICCHQTYYRIWLLWKIMLVLLAIVMSGSIAMAHPASKKTIMLPIS
jgi:hypothetical protein